jgi:Protein of unknown function (DUF3574)
VIQKPVPEVSRSRQSKTSQEVGGRVFRLGGAAALGAIVLLAGGCAVTATAPPRAVPVAAPASCPGGATASVVSTLFFGMASRDGRGVSEQAWDGFLATVVTPRFPDGLTVLSGYGQYRGPSAGAIVRETTKVLLVVHAGTAEQEQAIAEIIAAYRRAFDQEAVLHLARPACMR